MIDSILSNIAPHHCCGCDKIGSLLCDNCKNNITDETNSVCIVCGRPTAISNLCNTCKMPYERAWVVGDRKGILQRLVGLYKFERAKSAHKILAELLMLSLPDLPSDTILVPIPTTSARTRERGYDHILLIVKYMARAKKLKYARLLIRRSNTQQRQSSAAKRRQQAKLAFVVNEKLDPEIPYLLIDDVVTTGATIEFAAKALRDAGAGHVWVAAVARQTMEK